MASQDRPDSSIIKVIDKRRFSPDGNVRDDAREDPKKPVAPAATAAPPAQPNRGPAQQASNEEPAPPASGVDFINFIASLATSALASLGLLPEARARGIPTNLQAAREYIDVISMLQEKTKGNLSREEDASLTRLASELRAQFVQVSQAAAQAQAHAAAQRIPGAQGGAGMPRPLGR